jgi:hypothetical protein
MRGLAVLILCLSRSSSAFVHDSRSSILCTARGVHTESCGMQYDVEVAAGARSSTTALLLRGGSTPADKKASLTNVRGGSKQQQQSQVQTQAQAPVFDQQAYRKALLRTALVVLSAIAFGFGTMAVKGRQSGLEFFAGYVVEQSLSIDNLFVFIMLFEYFKVPPAYQGRVLTWGIIGAISMRAVMILVGVAAIQRFRSVILVFAGILLVSSVKLLTEKAVRTTLD